VALLRLLVELKKDLGIVLSVVHFNHQLRGEESEQDERFVAGLAREHQLEFHGDRGDVKAHAAEQHLSLEAAARAMRYEYFFRLLREGRMNRIATAHTLDDQAETVLLRLVRGAGTRGLAGIYPKKVASGQRLVDSEAKTTACVIRPLLKIRRPALEAYLKEIGQKWQEDSSNQDLRHSRNRVRHEILPCLEHGLNPAVRDALAETAEIAREEEEHWTAEVGRVLPAVWKKEGTGGTLNLGALKDLDLALRRRVVRAAAESLGLHLEFKHVEEILEVGFGEARAAALPHGWRASRRKHELSFAQDEGPELTSDYEYGLAVPGMVEVPEIATCFEALLVSRTGGGYNPEILLDADCAGRELRVRNWRAGDRFWPAHAKATKKVKELLQDRHVVGNERKLWPVIAAGAEVVWVRGFPARLRAKADDQVVRIREVPLAGFAAKVK